MCSDLLAPRFRHDIIHAHQQVEVDASCSLEELKRRVLDVVGIPLASTQGIDLSLNKKVHGARGAGGRRDVLMLPALRQ